MLYGSEEEKLRQSFELLDESGGGRVNYNDFRKIVSSFAQMWSAALGQPSKHTEKCFNYLQPL
jgi:Ca2+-binding EF-hand superfamily protein